MKGMKIFRDLVVALMIGLMGGLFVSVISYYHEHKEGGVSQTAFAVLNSFDTVAKAYGRDDLVHIDGEELANAQDGAANLESKGLSSQMEEIFNRIEEGDESVLTETKLAAVLAGIKGEGSADCDILAVDDANCDMQKNEPYDEILRFHVRANSDSEEDQALKMAVKEDVVTMLRPLLVNCKDVDESKQIIVANLQNIYTTAINTIVEQGYDYDVKVYVTQEEFPAKTYGDLTFPAGNYQALRIDIGKAEGQNWWCVMFPTLCFIDESTAVVSEEGKDALKRALTSEEYEALYAYYSGAETTEDITIKGESFVVNWWKEHMD